MKANVLDLQGNIIEEIELPKVFSEPLREDLILRAVLASQSNRRQPYGTDPLAGMRSSAHYHGYRRHRWTMMNREMARLPRLHGKLSPHLMWTVRLVPQAVKGRRAHPPKVEKIWEQKINDKERKKALRSAIAATVNRELVLKRGHKIEDVKSFPIIVSDEIEKISKTKDLIEFLEKIGLKKELERISEKKIRAGKGKSRGRKYKIKIGPLFVVSKNDGLSKAVRNILGCDICRVENISTEHLSPGAMPGRLVIWTKSSILKLSDNYGSV
jgi:large subunit ribosomal protein L4e